MLEKQPTIQIAHSSIVLVFHEHITELDLRAVHILASDHETRQAPPSLHFSVCQNISNLC